ncbi:hypothetical protein [Streptomyces sp. DH10]|nr:hypothetical protein [Streptomyces sp. DH10]MDG9709378.1 hypothetical protein [Streptomyces sp. DH10]
MPVLDVITRPSSTPKSMRGQQGDQRRISECPRTVAEYFAIEKPLLQPLP